MPGRLKTPSFSDSVLILAAVFLFFVIPEFPAFPAGCIFKKVTGFYCAGCGMSRGVHALLRWDISRAMHQNLLLITALPLSVLWYSIRFIVPGDLLKIKKYDTPVIVFFIIAVLVFTVMRNIPLTCFNFLRPL